MKIPATRQATPRGRAGGFTLIEILVAIAVFSIVVVAIYSTWMTVIHASRAVQQAASQAQREHITIQALEQALYSTHSYVADVDHYSFVLDNKSSSMLSFAAYLSQSFPLSGRFGSYGMRRIMFSLEGGDLVMRQTPILVEMSEDEQNHPLVLAKGVKTFKVEAMDPQKGDWTDEWLQTNQIPSMVRITVEFAPPDYSSYSAREKEGFQFEVALPSIAVQPSWQKPSMGAPGGNPAIAPGLNPGTVNPNPGITPPGGQNPAFRPQ